MVSSELIRVAQAFPEYAKSCPEHGLLMRRFLYDCLSYPRLPSEMPIANPSSTVLAQSCSGLSKY